MLLRDIFGEKQKTTSAIKSILGDPPTTRQAASAIGLSLLNATEVLARRFFDFFRDVPRGMLGFGSETKPNNKRALLKASPFRARMATVFKKT